MAGHLHVRKSSDSWLLMVGSQVANLILVPSFNHNLCFKCPNGSCEPILNIYVPRAFQWYNKVFNPLSFDPCNNSLKIWESTMTLIPKVEAPLGMWGFIPHIFLHSQENAVWFLGFPLGPQPCKPLPWSWTQSKVRVATSVIPSKHLNTLEHHLHLVKWQMQRY